MLPPSLSFSSLGSGSFFNRKKTRSMLPCPEHQNTVTLVSDGREVEINYLPIRNNKKKSVLPCRPSLQHGKGTLAWEWQWMLRSAFLNPSGLFIEEEALLTGP